MELTNGRLGIVIDDRSGSLTRIEDRANGLLHLAQTEDARLFRVVAPSGIWSSRHADSHACGVTNVRQQGRHVEMTFDRLAARGEPTGISAEVTVDLPPDSDEARFTIAVRNEGPDTVNEVRFPWVGGWQGHGGRLRDMMTLGAASEFDPHGFPHSRGKTYVRVHQRWSVPYPTELYAPWVDLSVPGGGISYVNYMTRPRNGFVCCENMAGYEPGLSLGFSWLFPVLIRPGETWTSDPIGISVHGGDWHATADRYREWMETWFRPAPGRRAHRASIGYQNVFLRGFDGTPIRRLDTVPDIARTGRRYGVDSLVLWDFIMLGNYSKHADLDLLDYTPDERETLARGIRQARSDGSHVGALINFRLTNPMSTLYETTSHHETIRSFDGSIRTESYCGSDGHGLMWTRHLGPISYVLSPFAPTFRERVLRQTREYLELGFNTMFFDQPFETRPDYGRVDAGCRPEDTYAALVDLVAEARAILQENDPDALMIGEYCEAFASQHVDLWMAWYRQVDPARRAAYALPQTMHSWVVDSSPGEASHAFAMGMHLCLCTHGIEGTLADEPAFAEHVAALAALRQRTAGRTVMARFVDTRGLEVSASDGLAAYAFDGPEGPCVVAASTGPQGEVEIHLDRAAFASPGAPDNGRLCRLGGQDQPACGDSLRLTLGQNEVAVWEA